MILTFEQLIIASIVIEVILIATTIARLYNNKDEKARYGIAG